MEFSETGYKGDGTGQGWRPMISFGIRFVEPSGYITIKLPCSPPPHPITIKMVCTVFEV
jgi:hypothetical protein